MGNDGGRIDNVGTSYIGLSTNAAGRPGTGGTPADDFDIDGVEGIYTADISPASPDAV